jgi:hypothetical protein
MQQVNRSPKSSKHWPIQYAHRSLHAACIPLRGLQCQPAQARPRTSQLVELEGCRNDTRYNQGGTMNTLTVVKYVFPAIGIAMLAGALFWVQNIRSFLAQASTAQGTVVELVQSRSRSSNSSTYAPVVRFVTAKGEKIEFTSGAGSNPPSYSQGESVEVLYEPGAPRDARINGFDSLWLGPTIVGGIGSIFFLIGGGIALASALQGRKVEYLTQNGTRILTTFQSVELNTSLTVNGRHPFRVFTQCANPSTSEIHVFKSDNLWFDPSPHIKDRAITVFIEPGNPKKYYVDLSFLPKLAV